MESAQDENVKKRKAEDIANSKSLEVGDAASDADLEDETEMNFSGSEEMELGISRIHEKVERYNQLVSELLENGKTLFNRLSNEFEERVILIHREQIEKWKEDIKELRVLDSKNEEQNAFLENAKSVLESVHVPRIR